jgi:hypothetical protein
MRDTLHTAYQEGYVVSEKDVGRNIPRVEKLDHGLEHEDLESSTRKEMPYQ